MRYSRNLTAAATVLCAGLVTGCTEQRELIWHDEVPGYRWAEVLPGSRGKVGFRRVDPSRTNISFRNRLTEEEIVRNRHYLNGSGVAAGDVDGDGLVDLYFARLNGPNRLYRNLGALRFEDITDSAGVAHDGHYTTGVVLTDVDGDRDLDLLVASMHEGVSLYINDGAARFHRASDGAFASTAGEGNSTLALADVDGDRDLDLYVTNYREDSINDLVELRELTWENTVEESHTEEGVAYALRPPFDEYFTVLVRDGMTPERREVGARDRLFLNDGQGRFREADFSAWFQSAAGQTHRLDRRWGLAAKFQDLNGDQRPDLYVANDFWTPDRVWINQGGAYFREIDPLAIRNVSFSSMAVDFSDVDRNGTLDMFVTEMLSPLHERRTRHHIPSDPFADTRFAIDGRPQYNRNSLYTGRGDGTYAETSYYSGLAASGWSWAAQFVDVDLDGYEDLIVTTGFAYDLQDLDTQLRINRAVAAGARASRGQLVDYAPLELVNRAFRNNGDLTFTDVSGQWGFDEKDISQALALGDLDNDGDLDVAINRLNRAPAIYENTATAPRIAVRLRGRVPNTQAVGATITLEGGPVVQTKEIASGGGYLSGSDPLAVFAAGGVPNYSVTVSWPDGRQSRIDGLRAGRIYEINQPDSTMDVEHAAPDSGVDSSAAVFVDVSDRIGHQHVEAEFDDWRLQPLLPVGLSRQGPGVSWIDFDRDGDDDLFIGAGRGTRIGVFENEGDGRFSARALDALTEPVGGDRTTILGWAEGDGTTIVVGNANLEQGNVGAPAVHHYALNSAGVVEQGQLPDNLSTTGALSAADYDGDGDLDLFVGGRFIPASYPRAATSRLFQNEDSRFVADAANAAALADLGLVTGAVFTDYDQDGDPDLLLSLEWGPLRLFRNERGTFRDVSAEVGLADYKGWWNGVATGDFDGDGRPDIVATNWGRNSPYQIDAEHPLRMYHDDFNWDGRVDVIEAYYDAASRDYVPRRQLHRYESIANTVLNRVRSHTEFAAATVAEILGHRAEGTPFLDVSILDHTVFLNRDGRFAATSLPREAQLSAGSGVVVADFDNDGNEDLFLAQNLFYVRDDLPRHDAGRGLWLRGDGRGDFTPVSGQASGIKIYGDQRGAAASDFNGDAKVDLVVAQNGAATRLYRNRSDRGGLRVRLEGPAANRDAYGSSVQIVYDDGTKGPRREIQAGSGYWSQNSAVQVLGVAEGRTPRRIEVRWFDGSASAVTVTGERRTYVIKQR